MGKLRVGLVGMGRGTVYVSQFQNHTRTEVNAICDVNPVILEEKRTAYGLKSSQVFQNYDDFVKADLDIVFIASPEPFHAEQAVKALEAGKHVLSEVGMATTVKDCDRIVQTVKRTGMKYMMAENYYYYNFIQEWKKIIQGGKLGRIFYTESEYVHPIRDILRDPKTGKLTWRANRPPLYYCSHCIGPLLLLLDDRIVKATASGKAITMMTDVGIGAIDMQVGIFETHKGATIKMLRSQVAPRAPPIVYYSIYGTKGFVENGRSAAWQNSKGTLYIEGGEARTVDCFISDLNIPEEARKGGQGTSEYYVIRDFIKAIDEDTEPPINAVRAADITIPGLIAHEAAMKGNIWLDVPHFE